MRDNRPGEQEAELLITSRLLKHKFNVTKPSLDKEGADLLIVDNIKGKTTKFLKVQSKLRTVSKKQGNSVNISMDYVTDNFVLFLYISRDEEEELLYTFFSEDILNWRITSNCYVLTLSEMSLPKLIDHKFDKTTATKIRTRLNAQSVKEFTSVIIDGIFLEKAIRDTKKIYSEIWPNKKFTTPTISELVGNFLYYNPFKSTSNNIKCVLFLSEHHSLETIVDFSGINMFKPLLEGVKLFVDKSDKIISFEVLSELERIINAENVILVADDPVYEVPLLELSEKGVDLLIFKMKHDSGSRLYTKFPYGDIVYPLGRSIGLESYEL